MLSPRPPGEGLGVRALEAAMPAEKRLVCITAANLKHSQLYVTGLRDFFPPEAFGGAKRKNGDEIRACPTR